MTTQYCKYHPLSQANWYCSTCQMSLCDDCIQPSVEREVLPTCLLCSKEVSSLQQAEAVVPFWLQYTHFMRLPLSLLGIFLLIVLFVFPQLFPDKLMLLAAFMAYSVSALYGWSLMQQSATGELKDINLQTLVKQTKGLALQISLVMGVVLTGLDWLSLHYSKVAMLLNIAAAIVFPAMLISATVDKSLSALFKVDQIKQVIASLRFFYVPVFMLSVVLWLISFAVISLLADVLMPLTAQGLNQSLHAYGVWVIMSVVGYVLFQFQQVLGIESQAKHKKRSIIAKQTDKQIARLEVYLKEGAFDKAASLLKTLAEKQPNNSDIQEKYYQLLVFMKDTELAPLQASNYMDALLQNGQKQQALQVFLKLKRLIPDFKPASPEMNFDLAKAFMETGGYQQVVDLLTDLHKEHPHFVALPEAYLLLSRVLYEKMNNQPLALETVEYLVNRFQKHPRFELIDKVWRSLGGKPKQDFII